MSVPDDIVFTAGKEYHYTILLIRSGRVKMIAKQITDFVPGSNSDLRPYCGILKKIGKQCGIKTKLTYHVSRHTMATTITLSQGVPIETVSRMLGHTNIKTTQIYAKITREKISQDMEILSRKLEGLEKQIIEKV